MPDAPSPKGRKKGSTRQRVLAASARLFAANGYAGTGISAICKAAGVAPSSIYWGFGNKAGILAAVLEDSAQRWLDESTQTVAKAMKARPRSDQDRLAVYFDYMAETLAKGPEFLRLMLMVALEHRHGDPRALEIVKSHRARSIGAVARVLAAFGLEGLEENGVTAREIATLTIACFDGAFIAGQVSADADELRQMLSLLHSSLAARLLPASAAPQKP